jgi:hypothetical protein
MRFWQGPTSSNLRDVYTMKYFIFPSKLLSSLYLRVDSAEVAHVGPEAVLLGPTSLNLRDVYTLKYFLFPAKLLSSLYLRVDRDEVAHGGPDPAVLLGSDIFKFEDVHYSTLPSTVHSFSRQITVVFLPGCGQCRGCAGRTRSRPAGVRHL